MPTNVGGLTYGTIAVAALLAAESTRRETYPRTVAAVAVTLVLYWLAHSYARFTGDRMEHREQFTLHGLLDTALHELSVLIGASVPFVVLLVCWAFGVSLVTGVTTADWTAAGMIVVIEAVIGLRTQLEGRELVIQTLIGALMGLLVVALRVLLH